MLKHHSFEQQESTRDPQAPHTLDKISTNPVQGSRLTGPRTPPPPAAPPGAPKLTEMRTVGRAFASYAFVIR